VQRTELDARLIRLASFSQAISAWFVSCFAEIMGCTKVWTALERHELTSVSWWRSETSLGPCLLTPRVGNVKSAVDERKIGINM
jgi:hypothetical protein